MRLLNVALLVAVVGLASVIVACGGGSPTSKTATANVTEQAAATLAPAATLPPLPTPTSAAVPAVAGQPTVTTSGLQIYELQVGTGKEAKAGSIVQIKYSEWLSTGYQVESTADPVRENLATGHVIAGWLEGIPGMKEGGKRRLISPPNLAFGAQGDGGEVPPNATIIADIELIAVLQ
jgi:FKBP-type peptidyl-prolyl cis-trans isomerase